MEIISQSLRSFTCKVKNTSSLELMLTLITYTGAKFMEDSSKSMILMVMKMDFTLELHG